MVASTVPVISDFQDSLYIPHASYTPCSYIRGSLWSMDAPLLLSDNTLLPAFIAVREARLAIHIVQTVTTTSVSVSATP